MVVSCASLAVWGDNRVGGSHHKFNEPGNIEMTIFGKIKWGKIGRLVLGQGSHCSFFTDTATASDAAVAVTAATVFPIGRSRRKEIKYH